MKSNEFNYAWLSDPEIFEVNRQPAHADLIFMQMMMNIKNRKLN